MVAELLAGQVVRSWIWQPQHDRAYVAELGAGAFCNGDRLTFAAPQAPARGVTSRRSWVGRTLPGLAPLDLSWASCGIDFPRLVEGATDYVLYGGTLPWDHAPGSLLVTEAGGVARTLHDGRYDPRHGSRDGLVAAADQPTYDVARSGWDEHAAPLTARARWTSLRARLPDGLSRWRRGRRPGWRRTRP